MSLTRTQEELIEGFVKGATEAFNRHNFIFAEEESNTDSVSIFADHGSRHFWIHINIGNIANESKLSASVWEIVEDGLGGEHDRKHDQILLNDGMDSDDAREALSGILKNII